MTSRRGWIYGAGRFGYLNRAALVSLFLKVGAFVPIIAGCIYLLIFMPAAPSIAVIQAIAESVAFEVSVPELAQVRLTGYSLWFEAPGIADLGFLPKTLASSTTRKALCLSGMLIPEPGTKVTYKRYRSGPVSAVFERTDGRSAATFEITAGSAPATLKQASWIRLEAETKDSDAKNGKDKAACDGEATMRLPIYGVADVGSELRPLGPGEEPTSGILIEGTLDIFAVTLDSVLFRNRAPRIYPAYDTAITLPPGSRVTEYVMEGASRQPWSGFAQPGTDEALAVKISTPATKLAIVRPGVRIKPEVLSISLFTRLSNDPVLISAQIIVAMMFGAFQVLSSALSWYSRRREGEQNEDDA